MWLNRKLRSSASWPGASRPVARRFHPLLEPLEDRLAPAILTVNSAADTANATDRYLSLREALAIVNSATLPMLSVRKSRTRSAARSTPGVLTRSCLTTLGSLSPSRWGARRWS